MCIILFKNIYIYIEETRLIYYYYLIKLKNKQINK